MLRAQVTNRKLVPKFIASELGENWDWERASTQSFIRPSIRYPLGIHHIRPC